MRRKMDGRNDGIHCAGPKLITRKGNHNDHNHNLLYLANLNLSFHCFCLRGSALPLANVEWDKGEKSEWDENG